MKSLFKTLSVIITLSISFSASAADHSKTWKKANAALDRGDVAAAVKLLRPVADAGDPEAQSFVGIVLWSGQTEGVPKDAINGTKYLTMCVNNPKTESESRGNCAFNMSLAYLRGDGVVKSMDDSLAFMWTSARYGNEKSFNQLNRAVCKGDASCTEELKVRLDRCEAMCLN
ncbi:MAG: hypothetical protein PXX77_07795 [Gallionella sp.]|nr:hypothetical protein [Gallionella sp.]